MIVPRKELRARLAAVLHWFVDGRDVSVPRAGLGLQHFWRCFAQDANRIFTVITISRMHHPIGEAAIVGEQQ